MRIPINSNLSNLSKTEIIHEENGGTKENLETTKIVLTRRYIRRREIENLAIRKYKECGRGIQYSDLVKEFNCSKAKAQRILKNSCSNTVRATIEERTDRRDPILFRSNKRTNPQTYFPRCMKADIIENLKDKIKRTQRIKAKDQIDNVTRKNLLRSFVPRDYGAKSRDNNNEDPLELARAENFHDVLKSLPFVCRGIHKIQLMTSINKEYYNDLDRIRARPVNRAKIHQENIGNRRVIYTFSPNGTVEISIACSNSPFKLDSDDDINLLFSFMGQVRDRLLYIVSDPHEREVPHVNEWVLKLCDLNKDVEITDKCQIVFPDLQLKYAGRVFRIYVKSLGDRAVARVEESLKIDLPLSGALKSVYLKTRCRR